jgi:uncharacterized membrane protein
MNQNYRNHRRFHPLFHFVLSLLLLITLVGVIVFVIKNGISLSSILLLAIVVILAIMFLLIRTYPLKAQDRAIRAEENLRHYVLTGKLLDTRLTMGQIIALRFAGDTELPELSAKAASQNLSPDDIKKQITNWKADFNRV